MNDELRLLPKSRIANKMPEPAEIGYDSTGS